MPLTTRAEKTRVTLHPVRTELLVRQGAGQDLVGRSAGKRLADPNEPWLSLGGEMGLNVEPCGEGTPRPLGAPKQP
jgi:hypothetical protein